MRKSLSIVLLVLLIVNSMAVGFAKNTEPITFEANTAIPIKETGNTPDGAMGISFNVGGTYEDKGEINYDFILVLPQGQDELVITLEGYTGKGDTSPASVDYRINNDDYTGSPEVTKRITLDLSELKYGDGVQVIDLWATWKRPGANSAQEVMHGTMYVERERGEFTLTTQANPVESGTTTGDGTYLENETAIATATEKQGWHFVNWTGDVESTDPEINVLMDTDKSITANFVRESYDLTVTAGEGGMASAETENPHEYEDIVGITATPAYGWTFAYWEGDVEQIDDINNPNTTIQMMGNQSAHAVFERELFTLNTIVNNPAGGTVVPMGSNSYEYDNVVNLIVTPAAGWYFNEWTGTDAEDVTMESATSGTIQMNADKTIVANFLEIPADEYKLTVSVDGNGSGSTTPDLGDHYYESGTINLTAVATVGSYFVEWTIDGESVTTASASVEMNQDHMAVAVFELDEYALTVTQVGEGTTTPLGADMIYHYGDTVDLTAAPAEGWSFAGWFDDGEEEPFSQSRNETITITADRIIEARYTEDPVDLYYSLTIEVIGEGAGITNPDEGPHSYLIANGESETVTVSANAADGSTFAGWFGPNGNEVTDNKIVLDENKTIIARFDLDPVTPPVDPVSMNFFADVSGIFSEDEANFMIQRDESQEDLTFKLLYSGPVPVATVTFSTAQENLNPILESDGSWTVNGFLPGELITMNVSNVNADFVYDYLEVNESADESLSYSFTVPEANFSSMAAFYEEEGTTPGGGGGFTPITYALKVKVVGNGTVNPSVGVHRYSPGTVVDLAPSAMNGWEFFGWDGAVQADQIVMNGDRTVTAIFKEIERVPLAPPTVTPPPIIILDEEVPKDDGALPDTGVDTSMSNLLLGAGSILLGILNRKKK